MERLNKNNLLDYLRQQQSFGGETNAFITDSFLYTFTQDTQTGITQFINTFVAKSELNAEKVAQSKEKDLFGNPLSNEQELTNSEIISQSLTEQYSAKTFGGKANPQPVFNQDGLAVQPEMKAVFLAEANAAMANLFKQTDVPQESEPLDFTNQVIGLKDKSSDEKQQALDKLLKGLVGYEFETQNGKIIAFKDGPQGNQHILDQNKRTSSQDQKRSIASVGNAEAIISNATQISDEAAVIDQDYKKDWDRVYKFSSPIKVGNDVFDVILTTNKIKDDTNPNRSYLYEIYTLKRTESLRKYSADPALSDASISQAESNVKDDGRDIYHQKANGYYDPELETIVLGKSTNSGTLPHEFAHFWLEKVFGLTHNAALINDRVVQQFGPLFEMLGVMDEQTQLTTDQHEAFATMTTRNDFD
jgi:hypothetical protein